MKKELNVQIGARVRKARERLHMSRETLSELLDISTLFMGYIECGQKGMSTETLIALCNALSVSSDYILMGVEQGSKSDSEAERLLHEMPTQYHELATGSLRNLLNIIAVVKSSHLEPAQDKANIKIAARTGSAQDIILSEKEAELLTVALEELKTRPLKTDD